MNIRKKERVGEEKYNEQGYLMKIVDYINCHHISVKFTQPQESIVTSGYDKFETGKIKNPYAPSVYGMGCAGVTYPTSENHKQLKEYKTWHGVLQRCFDEKYKQRQPTYKNVVVCEDWLNYEKFYEWIHSQENYEQWKNNNDWHIDKDILVKRNKVYAPDKCCLIPRDVNILFTKRDNYRGDYPIGVSYNKSNDGYSAMCSTKNGRARLGIYSTPEEAFYVYKHFKENLIKKIAKETYTKGEITKRCYEALMSYKVEITD